MNSRLVGCFLIFAFALLRADLPTPEALLESFEKKMASLDQGLDRGLTSAKAAWIKRLELTRAEARLEGRLSDWLWAERWLRVTREMGENWPGLFASPESGNEAVAGIRADLHAKLKKFLADQREAYEKEVKAIEERMVWLEKELVRADRIEEAIACREASARIEDDDRRKALNRKLKRLQPEKRWKQDRSRRRKLANSFKKLGVPPDTRFLFQKDNPAYRSVLRGVEIVSAGHAAGPASDIRLGRKARMRGTRGLAVVALYNREVLIEETFDTYAELSESTRLIEAIRELPYGAFVFMAARDDATRRFSGAADSALLRLGAKAGLRARPYRSAYLLAGVKGLMPGGAVERSDGERVAYP